MNWHNFRDKFLHHAQEKNSGAILKLNPSLVKLPLPIQRFDDPFLPFVKPIIDLTRDHVAAYWLDLASYLALGAAGARALERTIGYIGLETPKILHAPFVGKTYSAVVDSIAFAADALTLAFDDDIAHYLSNSPYAAFVRRTTLHDIPSQGGVFTQDERYLAFIDESHKIQIFSISGDDVLFAGFDENYAQTAQTQLLAKQWIYGHATK